MNFPKREYSASHGEDLYRRGVYTAWQRTFLHPSLLNFDAPTREECTVSRGTAIPYLKQLREQTAGNSSALEQIGDAAEPGRAHSGKTVSPIDTRTPIVYQDWTLQPGAVDPV